MPATALHVLHLDRMCESLSSRPTANRPCYVFTVSVSDSVSVILAAMETDADKQKEESAGSDSASATVSKGDASQVSIYTRVVP